MSTGPSPLPASHTHTLPHQRKLDRRPLRRLGLRVQTPLRNPPLNNRRRNPPSPLPPPRNRHIHLPPRPNPSSGPPHTGAPPCGAVRVEKTRDDGGVVYALRVGGNLVMEINESTELNRYSYLIRTFASEDAEDAARGPNPSPAPRWTTQY